MKHQGKRIEEKAYQAGYRVTEEGEVISPYSGKPLKLWMRKHGYMSFSYDHTEALAILAKWSHGLATFGTLQRPRLKLTSELARLSAEG